MGAGGAGRVWGGWGNEVSGISEWVTIVKRVWENGVRVGGHGGGVCVCAFLFWRPIFQVGLEVN